MKNSRIQLLLFCFLVPIGIFFWYLNDKNITVEEFLSPVPWMRVGDLPVKIEIARTQEERIRGLSGRTSLDTDGLLFVFPESDYHGIWMKDMLIPIDIIWISEDLKIVHIEKNVQPETYPKVFRPRVPARYVLETNNHYADTFGFQVGQPVTLPATAIE